MIESLIQVLAGRGGKGLHESEGVLALRVGGPVSPEGAPKFIYNALNLIYSSVCGQQSMIKILLFKITYRKDTSPHPQPLSPRHTALIPWQETSFKTQQEFTKILIILK